MILRAIYIALPLAFLSLPWQADADPFSVRFDPERSGAWATAFGNIKIDVAAGAPVPWRVFVLDEPARLIVDVKYLAWPMSATELYAGPDVIDQVNIGTFRPGWSRMVLHMAAPMRVETAALTPDDAGAVISISLSETTPENFRDLAGAPPGETWSVAASDVADLSDKPVIALDPGHGGIDPGAIRKGVAEKDIALSFALELRDALRADGRFDVFLTRSGDHYVSLSERVRTAQALDAKLFLSLHANTVTEGRASGSTVYTLSEDASDEAAEQLADLENRADLRAGLELETAVDTVAAALVNLARLETDLRSRKLAESLVSELRDDVGVLKTRPHRSADFRVLKAPDMPSVLLELGFLSNAKDRANMTNPEWRTKAAAAVANGISNWLNADAEWSEQLMK